MNLLVIEELQSQYDEFMSKRLITQEHIQLGKKLLSQVRAAGRYLVDYGERQQYLQIARDTGQRLFELTGEFPAIRLEPLEIEAEPIKAPIQQQPLITIQLPPRATHFTNRKAELAQLMNELQLGRVVTLCGAGGIGKTALAAEAAWRVPLDRFPDGIIFYSFHNQPQAEFALEHIALSFGEPPRPFPAAAALRALAGRKALLILDGAEKADNLPAVLAVRGRCGVLVTSRAHQDALATWRDISPLSLDDSVALLQAWGGEWAADEKVVRQIGELLGGLPLAVRLVGRYLAQHEEEAGDYLTWLSESPLSALDQGQHQLESVPLLVMKSLAEVSIAAKEAMGVIGKLELAPFCDQPIATALNLPVHQVGRLLGELINHGLLVRIKDKYQVSHALLHTFARQLVTTEDEVADLLRLRDAPQTLVLHAEHLL